MPVLKWASRVCDPPRVRHRQSLETGRRPENPNLAADRKAALGETQGFLGSFPGETLNAVTPTFQSACLPVSCFPYVPDAKAGFPRSQIPNPGSVGAAQSGSCCAPGGGFVRAERELLRSSRQIPSRRAGADALRSFSE